MKICSVRSFWFCVCSLVPAAAWGQPPTPPPPTAPTDPAPDPAPPPAPTPVPAPTPQPDPVTPPPTTPPTDKPPPIEESTPAKSSETRIYGYLNAFIGHLAPLATARPLEYDRAANESVESLVENQHNVDAFVMVQGTLGNRYRYFLNVAAPGAGDAIESTSIELRNAWVEASLYGEYLAVRAGRLYRRFGLYNELLDATPTFLGIKEPEIL